MKKRYEDGIYFLFILELNLSLRLISIMCMLVAQLYPTVCNPMDGSLHAPLSMKCSPGKNNGVGSHFLLQ